MSVLDVLKTILLDRGVDVGVQIVQDSGWLVRTGGGRYPRSVLCCGFCLLHVRNRSVA